ERTHGVGERRACRRWNWMTVDVAQIDELVAAPIIDAYGFADPVRTCNADEAGNISPHARQLGHALARPAVDAGNAGYDEGLDGHRSAQEISRRSCARSSCSMAKSLPCALRLGPVILVGHALRSVQVIAGRLRSPRSS